MRRNSHRMDQNDELSWAIHARASIFGIFQLNFVTKCISIFYSHLPQPARSDHNPQLITHTSRKHIRAWNLALYKRIYLPIIGNHPNRKTSSQGPHQYFLQIWKLIFHLKIKYHQDKHQKLDKEFCRKSLQSLQITIFICIDIILGSNSGWVVLLVTTKQNRLRGKLQRRRLCQSKASKRKQFLLHDKNSYFKYFFYIQTATHTFELALYKTRDLK